MTQIRDRTTAVVALGAVLFLWLSTADMPPEPQLFPRALLVAIGGISLAMLVRSFMSREAESPQPIFVDRRAFAIAAGSTLVLIVLIDELGFFTAGSLFLISATLLFGYRNYLMLLVSTALFMSFIYVIFVWIFERPLPREAILSLFS